MSIQNDREWLDNACLTSNWYGIKQGIDGYPIKDGDHYHISSEQNGNFKTEALEIYGLEITE